jgi:polar amino acid transport system substrate-binding protein
VLLTPSAQRASLALGELLGAVVVVLWLSAPAAPTDALRVCADPDNLPFSRAEGSERGLYVELAELVAARLGLSAEYAWFATNYGHRAVRNTLLARRCDAYIGLPDDPGFMSRSVIRTRPFLDVGYAVVGPPPLALSSLDDIKGRAVAVQFDTTPQIVLATRPGFRTVTFRLAEEAMEALSRGEADLAFLWGPTAGYYNKTRLRGAYKIVPIAGSGLQWQVTIGVRQGEDRLKADLDQVLGQLQPEIARLADKYGFPSGPAVSLDPPRGAPGRARAGLGPFELVQLQDDAESSAARAAPDTGPSGSSDLAIARLGRSLFNQHCAHCHAPNAMSPEPSRDLRRLKLRYGLQMQQTAYTIIWGGRPDKGMPSWKDLLDDDAVRTILLFLESVQREP